MKWHIAYTRLFIDSAGSHHLSRPVVTDEDELDPRSPHYEAFFGVRDSDFDFSQYEGAPVERWFFGAGFDTKEEADAALARWPIESVQLAGQAGRRMWTFADGRRAWEPPVFDKAAFMLDPQLRQEHYRNEYGAPERAAPMRDYSRSED